MGRSVSIPSLPYSDLILYLEVIAEVAAPEGINRFSGTGESSVSFLALGSFRKVSPSLIDCDGRWQPESVEY